VGEERTAYGECVGLVLFFLSAIVAVASSGKVGKSARERVAGSKMQLGLKICVKTLVQVLLSREGGHKRGGPLAPARRGPISVRHSVPFSSAHMTSILMTNGALIFLGNSWAPNCRLLEAYSLAIMVPMR
jgi:hypothetical protein